MADGPGRREGSYQAFLLSLASSFQRDMGVKMWQLKEKLTWHPPWSLILMSESQLVNQGQNVYEDNTPCLLSVLPLKSNMVNQLSNQLHFQTVCRQLGRDSCRSIKDIYIYVQGGGGGAGRGCPSSQKQFWFLPHIQLIRYARSSMKIRDPDRGGLWGELNRSLSH